MNVTLEKGQNLAQALAAQGVYMDLPCGGNGTCGLCKVRLAGLGEIKACRFRVPGTYAVTLPNTMQFDAITLEPEAGGKIPDIRPAAGWDDRPQMVVDLGTTTIVCKAFYRGQEASVWGVNPQRYFGADVTSRIQAAVMGHTAELQDMVCHFLLEAREKLETRLGAGISHVLVAGNTTMEHLLWGWDCKGLGRAPFTPVSLQLTQDVLPQIGGAQVCTIPGISAYVGGDIVSGIWRLGMHRGSSVQLLIDLGTNGEMALSKDGRLYVTSTAAGSAFEGSAPARKIYASGVFRCLHQMLEIGRMDETGLLHPECDDGVTPEVEITQEDIRDFQMAKAAIRAGIESLLAFAGLKANEVDGIYLAGGMGYYLDTNDALALGMLPQEFADKTRPAGNVALAGIVGMLQEGMEQTKAELEAICASSQEILLANDPLFAENYIRYMNFNKRKKC